MIRTVLLFAMFLAMGAAALAQTPTGQILGTVQDSAGLVVPGTQIVVTNEATGQRVAARSSATGDYQALSLVPGAYTVTAEKEGFKKFVHKGVTVSSFENVRVDVPLEVGAVSQSVFVAGEAPLVDTRAATVGTLIGDKRLVDLPLNGRNIISFSSIIPGVTRTSITSANEVSFSQQRVNINGNRAYSTNIQLDGGSMFYAHRGQSVNMPPPDAVEEIKVISSGVTAEYGRGTAVLSAVTKSGGNELHASLWNYFRNDDLDARRSTDQSKAKLRYNQFGGTVGGPIIKNRLFYFGSYQGIRTRQDASSSSAFPPTAEERRGDFSSSNPAPMDPLNNQPFPGRAIPTSRFDPVAVKLLEKIPLPNDPTGRLAGLSPTPTTGDNVIGKFDWAATQKNRFSFRYYFDYVQGVMAFPVVVSPGSNIPGYSPSPSSTDIQSLTLNYSRTWTPTLLLNLRGSLTRFTYDEAGGVRQTLADLGAQNFIDAGAPSPPRLPQIVVNGRFSASPGKDRQRIGSTYDYSGDWTWLRGRHEFKWGAQIFRTGFLTSNNSASSGRFVFDGTFTRNNMADYLLGRDVNFTQNSYTIQGGKYYIPSFYAQDNFKLTRRLTLNLGMRWEIYTPWREDNGQMAMYFPGAQSQTFPTAPRGFIYQTDPQYNYVTDGVNIGPRIGFAWDVLGDGKTSVRGSYAVSYDGLHSEYLLAGNQPFSLSVAINNPGTLSNPYANTHNPFPYKVDPANAKFDLPAAIGGNPAGPFEAAYVQNVSFTVQRQLSASWMAQAGYIGNYGRKLPVQNEFNPAVYVAGQSTTANTDARRRLAPVYRGFFASSWDANSSYNALQTMVTKRLAKGFTLVGHYTWSRAIDDSCQQETLDQCLQQDPFNRLGSRGLSEFDRRHVAVFSYLYELPFFKNGNPALKQTLGGWRIAGINTFQTGNPLTVVTGSDVSLTAVGRDRPDLIGDPALSKGRSTQEKMTQWFSPSAFRRNAAGVYGNAGRDIIIGPGSWNWDISFQKDFWLGSDRRRLEFRADLFNSVNHPNLGSPATNFGTPQSFGRITSTGSARVVQLALRYQF